MNNLPQKKIDEKVKSFLKTIKGWVAAFKTLPAEKQQYVIGLFSGIQVAETNPFIQKLSTEFRDLFLELVQQTNSEVKNG